MSLPFKESYIVNRVVSVCFLHFLYVFGKTYNILRSGFENFERFGETFVRFCKTKIKILRKVKDILEIF